MGVGGGGLLILYLTFVENQAQLYAQGVNLLFFLLCAAGALPVHIKKQKPDLTVMAVLCLAGAAGAVGGSLLAQIISVKLLRKLFGLFLLGSGLLVLFHSKKETGEKKRSDQDAV